MAKARDTFEAEPNGQQKELKIMPLTPSTQSVGRPRRKPRGDVEVK
jgi:hypothetical protein